MLCPLRMSAVFSSLCLSAGQGGSRQQARKSRSVAQLQVSCEMDAMQSEAPKLMYAKRLSDILRVLGRWL